MKIGTDEFNNMCVKLFSGNPKNKVMKKLEIYDYVIVPEPSYEFDDLHNHSFEGQIIDIRNNIATVEDFDGDCWDIELDRLTLSGD